MLLALGAVAARAADVKGDARVWLGAGIDTNPRRDFTSEGNFTPYDAFAAVVASGNAVVQTQWGRLYGTYDLGARKFFRYPSEDTLVQSAALDGAVLLGRSVAVGIRGKARDRRGAERDYSDLTGELYLEYVPDPAVSVKAHFGAHRFLYWNRFSASFWGPGMGAAAQYRFNRRHSVSLFAEAEPRSYNANACLKADDTSMGVICVTDPVPPRRQDTYFSVGLGYTYRGPLVVSMQYAYLDSTSNSYGETYRRHRFSGTAGVRLPLGFTLLAAAAVQIAQYPDGVFLSSDLITLEDDENANNVSLKLVHPLGRHFDLDFKYSVYFNKLLRNDLTYLRMVGSVGIGWHW